MQVKLSLCLILFLLALLFGSYSANAQTWQSLNGPLESDIRDIIIKNDTIYVASWDLGGFFKKALNSEQWFYSEIVEGTGAFRQGIEGLLSIEIVEDGIYYAGGGGIVTLGDGQAYSQFYKSNDYGKTWNEFRNGIESCHTVRDILIDPENNLLIGCSRGVFKFSDSENSFEKVGNKYGTNIFYSFNNTIISGSTIGAEYSTDSGDTWNDSGPDTLRVKAVTFGMDSFFFGTDQGLYTSTGIEQDWNLISSIGSTSIHSLFTYNNQVIVGTDSGAYLLDENLSTQPVFPELAGQKVQVINAHNDDMYVGTDSGFYECTVTEDTCELTGVANSWVRTMNFQSNDTLWAGTTENIHRYFLNTDQWDTLSMPIGRVRNIIPAGRDSFYVANDSYFQRCSFSSNSCDSLQIDPGKPLFDLKQNTAGDLFIASSDRVYKSSDEGENWEVIYTNPNTINFSLFTFSDSLLFINGGDLIKYSLYSDTYKTLNHGVSFVTNDGTIYAAVNGIQKSTDFGETWTTILQGSKTSNNRLGGIKFILFDEESGKIYAVTTAGGVYVTENGGLDWGVNEEMYPVYIESAAIGTDGTLYLGTGKAGVFANTQPLSPPITISNEFEPNQIPNSFTILPNYPNPFNPSTTISYELNSANKVILDVFNIVGQKIGSYNLGLKQSGVHNYNLDLSNQASGVYIIRIEAGSEVKSGKITLIK
tara:strand:+ start:1371 stop:3479 length:2109 start_codon:yes stop_codon:yes gene_type:complete